MDVRRLRAGLIVSFLSITIAEFATGSTKLTDIILNPGSFFLFSIPSLLGLYGCGVLLIREASLKWEKGWPSILLMGIAYGIMEEGFSVHTFFSPVDATVGVLGSYGKIYGLDLTWAIFISIFHAVFSISLPILISGRLFPELKNQRLLTGRSWIFIIAAYAATVLILTEIAPYRPSDLYLVLLVAVSAVLVAVSKRLPARLFVSVGLSYGIRRYLILGLIFFPFLFLFVRMQTSLSPVFPDLEMIMVSVLIYWQLESHFEGNSSRKTAFLALGLLVPVMVFGVIESILANPLGFAAIAVLAYVILRLFRVSAEPAPPTGSFPLP